MLNLLSRIMGDRADDPEAIHAKVKKADQKGFQYKLDQRKKAERKAEKRAKKAP